MDKTQFLALLTSILMAGDRKAHEGAILPLMDLAQKIISQATMTPTPTSTPTPQPVTVQGAVTAGTVTPVGPSIADTLGTFATMVVDELKKLLPTTPAPAPSSTTPAEPPKATTPPTT
jgi:hypothetical protein